MDNRNRKYPIIHLCLGELGPHHPENLLCLGEAGSLHPEILYCPGEEDSLHLIIYLCPGEPSSLHPENLLCSGEPGSPEMPAPARERKTERDGGRRSPEPLCLPRLGCSASREKHPRLAASATWSGSCRSGKAHHTEYRLLRALGNKCQSHRPRILTVLCFLFTKKL